jgi:hypothetical protein
MSDLTLISGPGPNNVYKAQYVAGGHQMEQTKDIMFASVVSRDSTIQIAFLIAAPNDLEVWSAPI